MSKVVNIRVLLFAAAREAAGNVSSIDVQLDKDSADTALIRKTLAEKYPKLASLVNNEEYITLALNEEYVPKGQILPLKAGDVIALIPPISGG